MTSAGPGAGVVGAAGGRLPMPAKIPAPMMAPMPSAISWIGPSVRFSWCAGSSASARIGSSDFVPEERVAHAGGAEDISGSAAAARNLQSRLAIWDRLGIALGSAGVAARPGREAALRGPRPARPRRHRGASRPRGAPRTAERRASRQVRWKISGAGLPVASIAETETTRKNARQPSASSSRGRCESQFEMTASSRPRPASSSSVGRTSPYTAHEPGSRKCVGETGESRVRDDSAVDRRAHAREEGAPEILLAARPRRSGPRRVRPGPGARPACRASRSASGSKRAPSSRKTRP